MRLLPILVVCSVLTIQLKCSYGLDITATTSALKTEKSLDELKKIVDEAKDNYEIEALFSIFTSYIKSGSSGREVRNVFIGSKWLNNTEIIESTEYLKSVESDTKAKGFEIAFRPTTERGEARKKENLPSIDSEWFIYMSLKADKSRALDKDDAVSLLTGKEEAADIRILEFALRFPDNRVECYRQSGLSVSEPESNKKLLEAVFRDQIQGKIEKISKKVIFIKYGYGGNPPQGFVERFSDLGLPIREYGDAELNIKRQIIRDRKTGEKGYVFNVRILRWLDEATAVIKSYFFATPTSGQSDILIYKLENGKWIQEIFLGMPEHIEFD